jgi:hypothetical protein
MPSTSGTNRPARTLLEQLIHERNQTLEEFAAYAETFAQEHGEPGTLSAGHLQRLVAGRRYDGRPLGRVRPATARLLETIFDANIDELLAPAQMRNEDSSATELDERLRISKRVDIKVINLLHAQLDAIRRLDRQLGTSVAHGEVQVKIEQVTQLLTYSLIPEVRARLATLLTELCMLAGWQTLDLRNAKESWHHYEHAKIAAKESNSITYVAHAAAQQAFVLIDLGRSREAVELLVEARRMASGSAPLLMQSWLAAAHGEALAARQEKTASLRAFDNAADLLTTDAPIEGPYVALDTVHLERWRGHALARLGINDAVSVLSSALDGLDPSFTRAEAALRVDLAYALVALNERGEAWRHASIATRVAHEIGSARQLRRVGRIKLSIDLPAMRS